jgi:hypothetical protein
MKWGFSPGRYANVTATMALIVSLGGTSYAAIKLPKDSVGANQLRADAVSSSKVKDASLLSKDFKAGQLPAGPHGPAGAPGAPGSKGDTGAPGAPGASATRLWAVIDMTTPRLVRGSGATAVEDVYYGWNNVVFDRDISACAWLATVEHDPGRAAYATVLPSGVSNTLTVIARSDNGIEVDGIVHVAVFC